MHFLPSHRFSKTDFKYLQTVKITRFFRGERKKGKQCGDTRRRVWRGVDCVYIGMLVFLRLTITRENAIKQKKVTVCECDRDEKNKEKSKETVEQIRLYHHRRLRSSYEYFAVSSFSLLFYFFYFLTREGKTKGRSHSLPSQFFYISTVDGHIKTIILDMYEVVCRCIEPVNSCMLACYTVRRNVFVRRNCGHKWHCEKSAAELCKKYSPEK